MKNSGILLFLVLILAAGMTACHGSKKATKSHSNDELSKYPLNFMRSDYLNDVLEEAKKEGKLVFIDMYADWCAPCKVMDEELYMNDAFAKIINENYISYKVNIEKGNGANLHTIFDIRVVPTLLFLDSDGNVLQRSDGALSYSHFLEMADRAVQISEK